MLIITMTAITTIQPITIPAIAPPLNFYFSSSMSYNLQILLSISYPSSSHLVHNLLSFI